jgi:hypothetical protein
MANKSVNVFRIPATSARVGAGRKPSNKKSPIGLLNLKPLEPGCQVGAQAENLGICSCIFTCIKRAALAATFEDLERLAAELRHAQASLALISASRRGRGHNDLAGRLVSVGGRQ